MAIVYQKPFTMILNINDNQFLIDLQEKFNECFPYLKIEFYDVPCTCGKLPTEEHQLPCNLRLCDCRQMHDPGLLDIKSYYKTGRIEADFKELFGLQVQIFRQDGDHWASTKKTKMLTLQQQSDLAKQRLNRARQLVQMI